MLCFTGFSVVTPFIVHAPARIGEEERVAHLARYRECVLGLASAPTISYPKLADYDERYVLKANRAGGSPVELSLSTGGSRVVC